MCAKWRNGYDPHLLLSKIKPLVSLSQTGGLVTSSFSYIYRLKHVLLSAIEFEPGIPESELASIVTDAVRDALQQEVFDADKVKVAISRAEKKFLKKEPEPYIFASSISLREMPPFRKVSVDNSKVVFSRKLPKVFDRQEAETRISRIMPVPLPSDYIAVRVTCDGRTPTEAAEKARGALGLMMGIWNFILTRGSTTISLSDTAGRPIASLRQGPLRTLHHPDGSMATSTIWYEPTYMRPAPVKDYSDNLKNVGRTWPWILKQITKSPDSANLRRAFTRYSEAVEQSKLDSAFLELWGLLEQLTGTGSDSYATTIRRASFIYDDSRLPREELQHLRDLRNNMVHLGRSSNDPQAHVHQLKKYIDDMFVYLLQKPNIALTRQEINEILDLPTDVEELKSRLAEFQRKSNLYKRVINNRTQ